jgi:deazaflavin-dependent oxidoreductase (nitroreductase family)
MARFNHLVTNRTIGKMAPWANAFGVVHHVGRKSGKEYRTPVNVFERDGKIVVALTYGSGTDWVRNVLAAGECDMTHRRQTLHLVEPELYEDPERSEMRGMTKVILRLNHVTEFLRFTVAPAAGTPSTPPRRGDEHVEGTR